MCASWALTGKRGPGDESVGNAGPSQVSGAGAQISGSDAGADWQSVRDASDIQYAPLPPIQPPKTPDWLQRLGEWMRELFEPLGKALGMSWPTMKYVLLAMAITLALYIIWLLVRPMVERWLARERQSIEAEEWVPDRQAAASLLSEAERLAAAGRFDEAVHLLLRRSVEDIAEARPDWLHPASTAREIAMLPLLSERAREAFGVIATRVERSLFALRELDQADWQAARDAYSSFALTELPT